MAHVEVRSSSGVRRMELVGGHITIGRQADNVIALPDDPLVSRHHATMELRAGIWWIRDLGSHNGTAVDGSPAEGLQPLVEGSRVVVGRSEIILHDAAEDAGATLTAHTGKAASSSKLSTRESEVLGLVAAGLTDEKIATRLFISVRTVRSHLDRIRDKTGRRRRADLVRFALEHHLHRPDA